jgi:hypothetical protein
LRSIVPAEAPSVVACCPLGDVVVAFDAACVSSVRDVSRGEAESEPGLLDLAQLFNVRLDSAITRRRRMDVRVGQQQLSVLVGEEVSIRELPAAPKSLPAFVAELGRRACIDAYIEWRKGYAYLLDVRLLSALPGDEGGAA